MSTAERTTVRLGTGEELTVRVCEPPFPGGTEDLCWWRDVAGDLMAGNLRPWLHTVWYLGEIDGERAGYMSCWSPGHSREVGLVEFVWTAEAHRRKGIASLLLGRLVEDFTRAGGLALYLCTTNPHAGRLYEGCGFRYFVGDGMRYLAPGAGDFDGDYLGGGGPAVVREATWADLPKVAAAARGRGRRRDLRRAAHGGPELPRGAGLHGHFAALRGRGDRGPPRARGGLRHGSAICCDLDVGLDGKLQWCGRSPVHMDRKRNRTHFLTPIYFHCGSRDLLSKPPTCRGNPQQFRMSRK